MRGFLNGVMWDHGVNQTLLLAVITLGTGEETSTNTQLVVRADMTEPRSRVVMGRLQKV